MGFIAILKGLFKSKTLTKRTIETTNITQYDTNSINIPKYSELSEEDKKIVDGFISEIDLENLDTLILYINEMAKYANANTELLVKLFYKITEKPSDLEFNQLSPKEIEERKLDAKVQREQIGLYRQGLEYLQKESSLRATALVEIGRRESKRKLDFLGLFGKAERLKRKNQMELLKSVTEQMKICKKAIEQQIQASTNAMQNEAIIATSIDIYNVLSRKDKDALQVIGKYFTNQEVLGQRVDTLLQMMRIVLPESEYILKNLKRKAVIDKNTSHNYFDEEQTVKALAIAQRKLDVYAYTHRNDLEQLRKQVLEIGHSEINVGNREQLLARINDIQIIYKVFAQYLKQEDLENLYQTKYNILTVGLDEQKDSPFLKIKDKEEMAYYQKIVEAKLERILKGENAEFLRVFRDNTARKHGSPKEAVSILKKIITAENGNLSGEGIILNKRLLMLLHSFDAENSYEDTENGFYAFIKAKNFDRNDLVDDLDNGELTWDDKFSLNAIVRLEEIVGNLNNPAVHVSPWINLFSLANGCSSDGLVATFYSSERCTVLLPEGITSLSFSSNGLHTNPYEAKIIQLCTDPKIKTIICPSTLKKIKAPSYRAKRFDIECIEFLEGLEEIEAGAFKDFSKLRLITTNCFKGGNSFPSSLRTIGNNAFSGCIQLEEPKLGEGLQKIGKAAFKDCYKFKRIKFPNSLRLIADNAFEGCENLEEVIINEGVESIGNRAFANNHSLVLYSVPNHEINIGNDLFKLDKQPCHMDSQHWRMKFLFEISVKSNITMQIRGKDIKQNILKYYSETISWDELISHLATYGAKYATRTEKVFDKRIKEIEIELSEKEEDGTPKIIKYVPKHSPFPNPDYDETPEQVYLNLTEEIRQYSQGREE